MASTAAPRPFPQFSPKSNTLLNPHPAHLPWLRQVITSMPAEDSARLQLVASTRRPQRQGRQQRLKVTVARLPAYFTGTGTRIQRIISLTLAWKPSSVQTVNLVMTLTLPLALTPTIDKSAKLTTIRMPHMSSATYAGCVAHSARLPSVSVARIRTRCMQMRMCTCDKNIIVKLMRGWHAQATCLQPFCWRGCTARQTTCSWPSRPPSAPCRRAAGSLFTFSPCRALPPLTLLFFRRGISVQHDRDPSTVLADCGCEVEHAV